MKKKNQKKSKWLLPASLWGLTLAGLTFNGCVLGDGDGKASSTNKPKTISSQQCAELTAEQQMRGDSLVLLAQKLQAENTKMLLSLENSSWKTIDEAKANQAIALYDEALKVAPGHCGAIFGRTLAKSAIMMQDESLNEALEQASEVNAENPEIPLASAFQSGPEGAAPLVLQVSTGLSSVEKTSLAKLQEEIATYFLPEIDTLISALEAVLGNEKFTYSYPTEYGDFVEYDASEIGPMLGGLKVVKSLMLVVCGYQWETAKDGSYEWVDRVEMIPAEDFVQLTASQRSDLDHLVSLFKVGSPFTRVKPEWKKEIKNIPNLLLEAVENTQVGLRYSLTESGKPGAQENDPIRVGIGEDDDLDPKEVQGMIDALERTKKYLRGEVAVTYGRGKSSIKVNFPKVFEWDGMQQYLPQFTVRPYEQWVISQDSMNSEDLDGFTFGARPFYFTDLAGKKSLEIDEIPSLIAEFGLTGLKGKIVFKDPTFGGVFPTLTNENIWTKIEEHGNSKFSIHIQCDEEGENCVHKLPENASDLDVWTHYLFWTDELL